MPLADFYARMRAGEQPRTAAVNIQNFADAFESALSAGQDVLYIGISSGISTTFNSARIAATELLEKYPERSIRVVDTMAASAGVGMIVYVAAEKKKAGLSLAENADALDALTAHNCVWFTVDDLEYLKRGGRVSPTVAFVGGLLGVKPVLHMGDDGTLTKVTTARGRKASLLALVDQMEKTVTDPANQVVFISHGDCLEDAQFVADEIKKRFGTQEFRFNYVGPVIGAHTGPGVVALFFLGKER
jgi:DegV family protein with EDD domain